MRAAMSRKPGHCVRAVVVGCEAESEKLSEMRKIRSSRIHSMKRRRPPFRPHDQGRQCQGTGGGDYEDALRNKKALVIPMILEAFGGISPHSLHFIRRLALRAKGARARDSTVYGGSSTSAKSFFVHHTQQLAAAAQVGDAKGIRKKITEMKMRLIKDALKATGRG